ncbi:MAG: hypothetical protein Kow006_05320 [Gammaproteobacteria bacterium]
MKLLKSFHTLLLALFASFNALMLYLFMLHLPFGFDPLVASFKHWDRLAPRIEIALAIAVVLAVVALVFVNRLSEEWKNSLTYHKGKLSHPATSVFFTTRRQPFETSDLLQAFPAVKEAAFAPKVQLQVWESVYRKHADVPLIASTRAYWFLMRDLYLLSLLFAGAFLVIWPLNGGVPLQLVLPYVFVFGAQFLFLMIGARGVGYRFVDNVLATELGIGPGQSGIKEEKRNKRRM